MKRSSVNLVYYGTADCWLRHFFSSGCLATRDWAASRSTRCLAACQKVKPGLEKRKAKSGNLDGRMARPRVS